MTNILPPPRFRLSASPATCRLSPPAALRSATAVPADLPVRHAISGRTQLGRVGLLALGWYPHRHSRWWDHTLEKVDGRTANKQMEKAPTTVWRCPLGSRP